MKRAIIRRIETWSCEVDVPDDATDEQVMDRLVRGKFEAEIDGMTYDACDYDVEIRE